MTAEQNAKPEANPANKTVEAAGARRRIPMSVPLRRLQVPEIPGYHLYWFNEDQVPRAQQGGYEFVEWNEVPVNQRNVATSLDISGNEDLGSRIRVVSGLGGDNRPMPLVLMKIKREWYEEDRALIAQRNAKQIKGIFRGEKILGAEQASAEDQDRMYVQHERTHIGSSDEPILPQRREQVPLLNRPPRKKLPR
jgi:hypothetical protein